MTRRFLFCLTITVFCSGARTTQGQTYYAPNYYPQNNDYYYPQNSYSQPQNYPAQNNPETETFFITDGDGPYFRADAGPSFFEDSRLTHFGVPANDPVKFKVGGTIDAAVGFAFNQYLSTDFELGFIGARVDSIKFFSSNKSSFYNLPFLANIIGSFPLQDGRIIPYFGGGVGGAVSVFDADNLTTPSPPGEPTLNGAESDVVFAGQIFFGVRFQLNSKMWLGAGYKYFTTGDPTWNYPGDFKFGMKGAVAHSLLFTFLWKF